MKQKPAHQWYMQDFLSSTDVQMMSAEEVGCYCLLLFNCYVNDGEIEGDPDRLALLCRGVKPSQRVLSKFYQTSAGKIRNKRVDEELNKYKKWVKKCSSGGKKSWEIRKAKGKMTSKGYLASSKAVTCKVKPNTSSSSSYKKNIYKYILKKYEDCFGTKLRVITETRKAKIRARLKSFTEEQIMQAIENFSKSPFHTGDNDRNWKADIDWIIKNDEQIEKGLNLEKTRKTKENTLDKLYPNQFPE